MVNIAYVIPNFLLFLICDLELMPICFLFSLLTQFVDGDEIKLIKKERNTVGLRNYHMVCDKTQNESFAALYKLRVHKKGVICVFCSLTRHLIHETYYKIY